MSDKKKLSVPPALKEQMNQVRVFGRLAPFLRFLAWLGIGGDQFKDLAGEMGKIEGQMVDLIQLPISFHDAFSELGWLCSESTNAETARKALELHKNGCTHEAETLLVADFDGERLEFMVRQLCHLDEFKMRWDQLHEACALTREGRYLAATPLLLIIADGVGTDAFGKSIFAEGVDLEELNSFAGQPDALPKLVRKICETRRKTRSDYLSFPYRNGIIHGRDLGYDNQLVNAKCWSLLGNIADVINARNKVQELESEPEPSLGEALKGLIRTREFRQRIEEWAPRPVIDERICVSAEVESSLNSGEPEAALVAFLQAWKARNYGRMAQMTHYTQQLPVNQRAGEIRERMRELVLIDAAITRIEDKAAAMTEISVDLNFRDGEQEFINDYVFRMLCYDKEDSPAIHGDDGAQWRVTREYQNQYWAKPWA